MDLLFQNPGILNALILRACCRQDRYSNDKKEEKSLERKLRIIYFNLLGLHRGKSKIHRVLISQWHIARERAPEASYGSQCSSGEALKIPIC